MATATRTPSKARQAKEAAAKADPVKEGRNALAVVLPVLAMLMFSATAGGMYTMVNNYNTNFAESPLQPQDFLSSDGWFSLIWASVQHNVDAGLAEHKQDLFGNLAGGGLNILEYGPGYGSNFRYFNGSDVTVVEPNQFMHASLAAEAEANGLKSITILSSEDEALALDDESFDVAVSALVLCSVPDPRASIATIYRLLRPYGQLLFLEHVAAENGSLLRKVQGAVTPLWAPMAGGCHLDRNVDLMVREQEWHMASALNFNSSSASALLIKDFVRGYAIKPAESAPADLSILVAPPAVAEEEEEAVESPAPPAEVDEAIVDASVAELMGEDEEEVDMEASNASDVPEEVEAVEEEPEEAPAAAE